MKISNWVTYQPLLRIKLKPIRFALLGLDVFEYVVVETEELISSENRGESILVSRISKFLKKISFFRQISLKRLVANGIIALVILVTAIVFSPELYYRFVPINTIPVKSTQSGTPLGGDFNAGPWFRTVVSSAISLGEDSFGNGGQDNQDEAQNDAKNQNINQSQDQNQQENQAVKKPTRYLPPQDKTLPEGDWLSIPAIGVRTAMLETANPEEALMEGVWKVPEYGDPGQLDSPIILVAHRFGWDWWWQSEYWRYNSFYLLPETQPGDSIEIISDQRKWVYEIYAGAEGSEITDYNADMILYTCKFLTSPVRHFRYARLIDVDADTQR